MANSTFAGPGVVIETLTRAGASGGSGADSGRYFVAGLFERGRTDAPVLVKSVKELVDHFGDRTAYSAAWDSLSTYFAEGGSQAYVLRVAGPAATKGTLTLKDAQNADSLKVDALGAGSWSTSVTVEVLAGTTPNTAKILVRSGSTVEVYDNMGTASEAASRLTSSNLVRGTAMGGGLPAVSTSGAVALSAGSDDRASVTAATMTDALDKIPGTLGTGAVALPGYPADSVGAALIAHAKATRRVAILGLAVGTSPNAAKLAAQQLTGADGSYAMLAYPWVRIQLAPGVTQLISPEGYVAAARARAHTADGPWGAAAGPNSTARSLVGLEVETGNSDGSDLNAAGVSVIRTVGRSIMLYGYRSLAVDAANYRLLSAQDTMNYLAQRCEDALAAYVFAPINSGTLGQVEGSLRGICEDIRARRGLYELYTDSTPRELVDPGYSVDVAGVNTRESLAQHQLNAVVAVRLTENAELVHLSLIRVALTAAI